MLSKNDIVRLKIEDLTSEGMGVGHTEDGFVIFCSNAVPGDTVSAHILKVSKSYAYAKSDEILSPSPMRCKTDCEVFEKCGGCLYRHIKYENELEIKKKWVTDNFHKIAHIDLGNIEILSAPEHDRYRNKAQYPAGYDKDGKVRFGFFASHTHRIVPCENCRLEPEEFSAIVSVTEAFCNRFGITPYDDEKHSGLIRHLYIRKAWATGEIMVALIINGEKIPHIEEYVSSVTQLQKNVKSIVAIINKKPGNVILGDRYETVYGEDSITDTLCGLSFNISPFSFYQVNHEGCELLYSKVREYADVSEGDTVIDLYCGIGTIGLSMAKNVRKLIGVEIIPQAIENAKLNAKNNGIDNAEFICSDAEKAALELANQNIRPDTVILDPPRKGCGNEVFTAIQKMKPKKIVMVSCNSATAARDVACLSDIGYSIKNSVTVDMFPRTGHVETVCLLTN